MNLGQWSEEVSEDFPLEYKMQDWEGILLPVAR